MNQSRERTKLHDFLPKEWAELLGTHYLGVDEEFETRFLEIGAQVSEERRKGPVYPKTGEVFRALEETKPDDVKICLLSMDPYNNLYKGEPVACGLSFAPRDIENTPASLRIIQKGANEDLGGGVLDWFSLPSQGVLLLNAALTVRHKQAGSHLHIWEPFTIHLLKRLQFDNPGLVFILWGRDAGRYKSFISTALQYILEADHPAYSAYSGQPWKHNNYFSEANRLLKSQRKEEVRWLK